MISDASNMLLKLPHRSKLIHFINIGIMINACNERICVEF